MRTTIKYFLLVFSLLFVVQGCLDINGGQREPGQSFQMINNSGQRITMKYATESTDKDNMSIITLGIGEIYSSSPSPNPIYLYSNIQELYFNDILVKNIDDKRNPFTKENYVKEIVSQYQYVYTFTFMPEDYQNALNQE